MAKEQIANKQASPYNVISSSTVFGNVYSPKPEFSDPGLLGLANAGNKSNGMSDTGNTVIFLTCELFLFFYNCKLKTENAKSPRE